MYLIQKTEYFDKWLRKLKDIRAKAKILTRLKRIELGNLGEYRPLRSNLFEIKIDYGPGYRIYFSFRERTVILLLIGGDKSTQERDIKKALEILHEVENKNE